MLSDACHDFAYGDSDLKTLIDELDHCEKEYRAIYPKELIDALRKLARATEDSAEAMANLVRACLDVRNHYDCPRLSVAYNGRDLAKRLLSRYSIS